MEIGFRTIEGRSPCPCHQARTRALLKIIVSVCVLKIRTDINRAPAGAEGCIIFEGREKWARAHAHGEANVWI